MRGIVRKADIVLGIVMAVLCGILCWSVYGEGSSGAEVVISVDGEVYGRYSLDENRVIDIDGAGKHNSVSIENGKAFMSEADCPDGYCLEQYRSAGGIYRVNQTIVCLPNRVVVYIENGEGESGEPDAVAGGGGFDG